MRHGGVPANKSSVRALDQGRVPRIFNAGWTASSTAPCELIFLQSHVCEMSLSVLELQARRRHLIRPSEGVQGTFPIENFGSQSVFGTRSCTRAPGSWLVAALLEHHDRPQKESTLLGAVLFSRPGPFRMQYESFYLSWGPGPCQSDRRFRRYATWSCRCTSKVTTVALYTTAFVTSLTSAWS